MNAKYFNKEIEMKILATLMLLALTSVASANGGLSLGTVDQNSGVPAYSNSNDGSIDTSKFAQAPVDQFEMAINESEISQSEINS